LTLQETVKRNLNLTIFSVLTIFLIFIGTIVFINVGSWLFVSDPIPAKLDVILTFAGENVRVTYSRELVSKNPGSYWILSDYRDGYARLLRKSNYDMSKVIVIDTCQSTFSEINALNTWLKHYQSGTAMPEKPLSIGLVSSPYHMRRINLMINKQFKKSPNKFYYLPVPLERYNWSRSMFKKWWKSESISKVVYSEIQKIFYFLVISHNS